MNVNPIHIIEQASPAQAEQPGSVDLRKFWSVFKRRWLILAACIVTVASLVAIWLTVATPIYTATATVLIDPRKTNMMKGDDAILSNLELDANTMATEVSLAKSFAVSRRVAERLKLSDDPQFIASTRPGFLGRIRKALLGSDSKSAAEQREVEGLKAQLQLPQATLNVVDQLDRMIKVRRVATTYFIEIAASNRDAELSAKLANALAESYLDEQSEARYRATQRASSWLNDRVSALRTQLEASERAVAEHRAKYNLANPQGGTLAEQQANDVNTQLVAARAETVAKKTKYEQAQQILDSGASLEKTAGAMESDTLNALRSQEADIARQQADLLTRYGPEHPAIRKVRGLHADVLRQVKVEVRRIVQTLMTDYELAQKKEASLEASLRELTASHNLDNQAIIRARELERDVGSNRTLYDAMLARLKEVQQQISLQDAQSRIVAPAFVPDTPSFPKKWLFLSLAVFAGLALGTAVISLLEYLENGFTAASQVEQTLNFPLLAMIPMLSKSERYVDGRMTNVPEYAMLRPQSRFGESIRSARMMTQMSNIDQPPKLVLLTSSISGEGKTTVAMSLALSATSSAKQNVLVVDCDLRAQSLSRQFGLVEKPGLTDFLTDQIPEERALYRANVPGLTILPAGTVTTNPPDILGSERMRMLLLKLCQHHDIVYVDGPPLLPVIDSVLLANFAEKILFVVRWRTTPRNVALRATQMLENSLQKLAGVVLNGAQLNELMNYDPYNTYYHKSYETYYAQ